MDAETRATLLALPDWLLYRLIANSRDTPRSSVALLSEWARTYGGDSGSVARVAALRAALGAA